jgi:multidrug transporter EmrE-like cation transporter
MSDSSSNNGNKTKCGLFEYAIFLAAIVTGTACSICSKTMMELQGIGINGQIQSFEKPIFQTFGMFVGMLFGLVMHYAVILFRIPFPGYEFHGAVPASKNALVSSETAGLIQQPAIGSMYGTTPTSTSTPNGNSKNTVPVWMLFFLAIPSIFDLLATVLCMMGLRYINVSIYQLLRGSGIIFVALMKQFYLKHTLRRFQWLGVAYNVVSVVLVGMTAVLNQADDQADNDYATNDSTSAGDGRKAIFGILLVLAGAFVQALQFVFEEKVMTGMGDVESSVPPLLLIGMEGLWGTVLCLIVVYPIAFFMPGTDYEGRYEDFFNTIHMLWYTPTIQYAFCIYFVVIFGYNLFAVMVTFMLNSIWHAILDNFRPITVWGTDMFIYYVITTSGNFGEPWTVYSWIQLFGMVVLLYGTGIYNAPNAGSIQCLGQWYHLGFNFSAEYIEIENEMLEDLEWANRKLEFNNRRPSSIVAKI